MNTYRIYTGMERSSQIPWQDDCYMVLKSTPKAGARKKMEGKNALAVSLTNTYAHTLRSINFIVLCLFQSDAGWLRKHQKSLQRFTTDPLLVDIVNHMRKSDELSAEDAGIIKEAGSLEDKVHALIELLFRGDPQGTALQAYLQSSHLDVYKLITLHGECVQGQFPYSE